MVNKDVPLVILGCGQVGISVGHAFKKSDVQLHVLCRREESTRAAVKELGLDKRYGWFGDLTNREVEPRSLVGRIATQGISPLERLIELIGYCDVIDTTSIATSSAEITIGKKDEDSYAVAAKFLRERATELHHLLAKNLIRRYVRVSTTGLGAWGLDIPFTHGDAQQGLLSPGLWHKVIVAGSEHQLLWALSRSFGSRVSLVIPAAFVGFENQEAILHNPESIAGKPIGAGEDCLYTSEELAVLGSELQMGTVTSDEVAATVRRIISKGEVSNDILTALRNTSMVGSPHGASVRKAMLKSMRSAPGPLVTGSLGPKVTKALLLLRGIRWYLSFSPVYRRGFEWDQGLESLVKQADISGLSVAGKEHSSKVDICLCEACLSNSAERLNRVLLESGAYSSSDNTLISWMNKFDGEGDILAWLWKREAETSYISMWPGERGLADAN